MPAEDVDIYDQRIAEVQSEVSDAVRRIHEQLDRLQRALGIVSEEQEDRQ